MAELRAALESARPLVESRACVYLTGSFGRGEASRHSDLDLFIVGLGTDAERALPRLDEILVEARLIEVARGLGFPEFSGDGEYLVHHTVDSLVEKLGQPQDDATNKFTARLLLLLESQPLLGEATYGEIIRRVIGAYWRDYDDHRDEFVPAFLANDILRLWRTFCVNYEASTKTEPPEKRAKRRLKNYKLKHSRLLTCYSGLAYLLAVFAERRTVAPDDAERMVSLTPSERLEELAARPRFSEARDQVDQILSLYDGFLEATGGTPAELTERFLNREQVQRWSHNAALLGDAVHRLVEGIGRGTELHRLLVV